MKATTSPNIFMLTKIQEAPPAYLQPLPSKQTTLSAQIEVEKICKIKRCVEADKNNAELYKKMSKQFITNLRNGQDQMLFCCGLDEPARLETSVGCKKNPGIFLIAGISVLDEKYQDDFSNFDVEVSFMEHSEGKMYDLLACTKMPLRMTKKDQDVTFGETYCKISSFNQFLKLLKIALFNNKERDFKVEDNHNMAKSPEAKTKSSMLMTIVTKKYGLVFKNGTRMQKTLVVDFAGSKPTVCTTENSAQKGLWQYLMIQLNNMTTKKRLHYHLVEANPFLSLLKNYLKSKTFILVSLSADPYKFDNNFRFITQLGELVEAIPLSQPTMPNLSAVRDKKESSTCEKDTSEKEAAQYVEDTVKNLADEIKTKKYSSLRSFKEIKERNIKIIDSMIQWVQQYRRVFARLFQNKRKIALMQNQLITDQIRLIGVCVKSDHYKDFYQAKSYLALEREVLIKTEDTREQICSLTQAKYEIRDKFSEVRLKSVDLIQRIPAAEFADLNSIKDLAQKIVQFMIKTFYNALMLTQRTLVDEILKEEHVNQNLNKLAKSLTGLKKQINEIGKSSEIKFEIDNFKKDAHLAVLIKQVQTIVNRQQAKTKAKNKSTKPEFKQNNEKSNNPSFAGIHQKPSRTKFTKLPNLSEKQINFHLVGNFELASLLLNPYEQQ